MDETALPPPRTRGRVSLEQAIAGRRSVREFAGDPLSDEELGQLLWAAQGITERRGAYRAAPSAGATYPLETYVVSASGIFRYLPKKHRLARLDRDDHRAELARAALDQSCVAAAPAVLVLTGATERTTGRYGEHGITYVHMEAGHAAQNVHLQAVALGLGSVPVAAFEDDEVARVLGCPRSETPLYLIPVGRPARRGV